MVNKTSLESGRFMIGDVIRHESAHRLQHDLGTLSRGVEHNDLFKLTREAVWARAYGHGFLTRDELQTSVTRVNQIVQSKLDQLELLKSPTHPRRESLDLVKYEKVVEDLKNHLLDMDHILPPGRTDYELQKTPFPGHASASAGGGV